MRWPGCTPHDAAGAWLLGALLALRLRAARAARGGAAWAWRCWTALVVLVAQAPADPYFAAQPAGLGAGPLHPLPRPGAVDRLAVALCRDGLAAGAAGAPTTSSPGPAERAAYNSRTMSYYQHHIFFCLNQRDNGEACCAQHDAQAGFDHCKSRVKAAGLAGPGGVRVNKAGCLDRCAGGPVAVVYPEAVWYTYVDQQRHRRDRRVAPEERPGRRAPAAGARRRPLSARRMNSRRRSARLSPARRRARMRASTRRPAAPRGVAVVCHPHPQHGGTMDNKVVQTLARAFVQLRLPRACASTSAASARRDGALGRRPRRDRRCAGGDRRAPRRRPAAGAGRLFLRRLRRGAAPRRGCRTSAQPSGWCWSARRRQTLRRGAGAGRHAGDPRRGRRRGAAGGHARLGAAAGAAGDRGSRRRPFLPRAAAAAQVPGGAPPGSASAPAFLAFFKRSR